MSSLLSPVLANIFMEVFETELFTHLRGRPLLWLRDFDDVFSVYPNNSDSNLFLSQLNNSVGSFKFTGEQEQHDSLPFLDTITY